eukprot:COSAG04_NODE_443_length_14310_cov_2.318275_2_plen_573_part_00
MAAADDTKQFWAALENEDLKEAERLLVDGVVNADMLNASGQPAFIAACAGIGLSQLEAEGAAGAAGLRRHAGMRVMEMLKTAGANLHAGDPTRNNRSALMTLVTANKEHEDMGYAECNRVERLDIGVGSGSEANADEAAQAITALLEWGADVNGVDDGGNTALHEAAKVGTGWESAPPRVELKIAQVLLDKGADQSKRNNDGKTALDVAHDNGNAEMVAFLTFLEARQVEAAMAEELGLAVTEAEMVAEFRDNLEACSCTVGPYMCPLLPWQDEYEEEYGCMGGRDGLGYTLFDCGSTDVSDRVGEFKIGPAAQSYVSRLPQNVKDDLLMNAARRSLRPSTHEDSSRAVRMLVDAGANKAKRDKDGNTAYDVVIDQPHMAELVKPGRAARALDFFRRPGSCIGEKGPTGNFWRFRKNPVYIALGVLTLVLAAHVYQLHDRRDRAESQLRACENALTDEPTAPSGYYSGTGSQREMDDFRDKYSEWQRKSEACFDASRAAVSGCSSDCELFWQLFVLFVAALFCAATCGLLCPGYCGRSGGNWFCCGKRCAKQKATEEQLVVQDDQPAGDDQL